MSCETPWTYGKYVNQYEDWLIYVRLITSGSSRLKKGLTNKLTTENQQYRRWRLLIISEKLARLPMRITTSWTESRKVIKIMLVLIANIDSLKMTPMSVKMMSCETTKKAKYRAITARSSREWVRAPMYWIEQLSIIGSKLSRDNKPWSANA